MGNNTEHSPEASASENLHARQPIEIPVPPDVAARLMEQHGQATDQAESSPSPELDPVEQDTMIKHMLRIGARLLDEQEFTLFAGSCAGNDIADVAKTAGVTAKQARKILDGATDKVRASLIDEALRAYVAGKRDDGLDLVRQWFRGGLVVSKLHQWGPLSALLFMYAAANDDRELTLADAYRACGAKPPVTEALKVLIGLGYVDMNVVTGKIRIKRLPTDAPRGAVKEAA
jgi:hypothetical protein